MTADGLSTAAPGVATEGLRLALTALGASIGLPEAAHPLAFDVTRGTIATSATATGLACALAAGFWFGQIARLQRIAWDLRSVAGGLVLTPTLADARVALLAFVPSLALRLVLSLPRLGLGGIELAPLTVGLGLASMGVALAVLPLLRPTRAHPPRWAGPLVLGLAQGAAVFPGTSRLGIGVVALCLLGVGGRRAVDVALLATLPHALFDGVRALVAGDVPSLGSFALAAVVATLGVSLLRRIGEADRVSWLGAWGTAVGLALVAFGRAL
jgi:hypothetical protein